MNNSQEIRDIVTQLQRLQIQESELLLCLEQRSEDNNSNNNARQQASATRELTIGDHVRIKNPRFLQANSRTISNITAKRITVLTQEGSSIIQSHKNIVLA